MVGDGSSSSTVGDEKSLNLYGKNVAGPIKAMMAGTKKPRKTYDTPPQPGNQAQDGKFCSK